MLSFAFATHHVQCAIDGAIAAPVNAPERGCSFLQTLIL